MTDLPSVNATRLIRALQRAGFFVHHVTGGHYVLKHPGRPAVRIVVPHHGSADVKRGILRSILRQAGLTADELVRANSVKRVGTASRRHISASASSAPPKAA
jgi:predicted RNA binding protein YcfA (HicA-like mRNA interferase family)